MNMLASHEAKGIVGWQQSLIDAGEIPASLKLAMESEEVRAVTAALIGEMERDPREVFQGTPIACPGAPYRRNKSAV